MQQYDERPLRRLLRLAIPEWRRIAAGTVFLALGTVATLAAPQALRVLIDQAVSSGDTGTVDRTALVMAGLLILQAASGALRYVLFTTAGERVVASLREQLYDALMRQEIAFFDQRRTGELMSRLSSDAGVVQNTVSVNISMALRGLASISGGLALLAWTSPKLTLLMLAVVPPAILAAFTYGRRIRHLSRDAQDAIAVASEVAEETIGGVRTVRVFAAEAREGLRYKNAVELAFTVAKKRISISGVFFAVSSTVGFAAAVAVLWYGGRLVVGGAMSMGELTAFLVYTMLIAGSLGMLSNLWADFSRAMGAAQRIFEIMDRTPGMHTVGGIRPDHAPLSLSFTGVRFSYPTRPDHPALGDVSFRAAHGEVVAIVGPSGAGKSTIASLTARLYDPDSGVIRFGDLDVKELDPDWLRHQVGVVAQEPILFSTTVAENIRYGRPDATDEEVAEAAKVANAYDFVSKFPDGFATEVGERGVQLSGGQKQRVAIARALLEDPAILILDEATSALDAESEHLVQEALERLMSGRITLVIAHRLSTVRDATRVLVLDGGHVVQVGPHDKLVGEDGLYRKLVERQLVAG
ncbi:MAG: ATP-binding cassette subfamily B protein [Bradymonadia bacterium]|jgi:ATP-binding cassette subfamily B protein